MDTQDYFLSPMRRQIIETLFVIRGANAEVLAQYVQGTLACTPQQKKQIINQLHRLKEKGLVTSKKLEGKHAGSMYYLSAVGLELAKKLLDVKPLQRGSMWLKYRYPFNQKTKDGLRDYSYEAYKPPERQHKHHHLILRSIVSLFGSASNLKPYSYRLTLDSYKKYEREGKEYTLKPDAEFAIGKEIYTLEIDRSTESYHQLVQKFRNYKHYLDYAKSKEDLYSIRKIIFVIEDTERDFGMSRRWGTIFKAYLEGMDITDEYKSWPAIDIILTTVSELASVVEYDISMQQVEQNTCLSSVRDLITVNQFTDKEIVSYLVRKDNCAIYLNAGNDQLIYTASYPYYTSAFYRYLTDFHSNVDRYFNIRHSYMSYFTVLISGFRRQNWMINWSNSNVDREVRETIDLRLKHVQFLKRNN